MFEDPAANVRPQDVISWQAFQATETASHDVDVALRMNATQPWRVYVRNLKIAAPVGYTVNRLTPPPTHKFMDPVENKEVDVYEGGEFDLTLSGPPWQRSTLPVEITYVGCTNVICLFPYTQTIEVPFVRLAAAEIANAGSAQGAPATEPAASTESARAAAAPATADNSAGVAPAAGDFESRLAAQLRGGSATGSVAFSFSLSLLALIFIGGILSNLTPCVAPMVPITLRLLARQGGLPLVNATIYALGIVVTYSALGLIAALSGGLFGSLLASTGFNLVFALIMIALGLSMLGFGDFSTLQNLGNRIGTKNASPLNTFLMGVGAGFVAAPCTGPILAALLAYAAGHGSSVAAATGLLFVYSLGFALPYVALGGAAAKISAFRVPPKAQIAVKLLFASVMLGLGFYYLRIPFYAFMQTLRPHWGPLAAAALGLGLGLTAAFVWKPGLAASKVLSIVPTVILGFGIFAGWQVVTTQQNLLHINFAGGETAPVDLIWLHSESEAIAAATAAHRPILIDMWAEWCEACKKMDITTMADPQIRAQLAAHWVLLRLDLTESNPATDAIQQKYQIQSLPTLVLLPAGGDMAQKQAITGYVAAETLASETAPVSHQGG